MDVRKRDILDACERAIKQIEAKRAQYKAEFDKEFPDPEPAIEKPDGPWYSFFLEFLFGGDDDPWVSAEEDFVRGLANVKHLHYGETDLKMAKRLQRAMEVTVPDVVDISLDAADFVARWR